MVSSRSSSTSGHRHDLVVERAAVPGGRRRLVALQRERVLLPRARSRSWSARISAPSPSETVHSSGIFGLTIRQPSVVECSVWSCARGNGFSGLSTTHGARLIDSTPPATQTDASPTAIARLAWIAASRPEPHRRLTVAPGTVVGRPGEQHRHPRDVAVVLAGPVGVAEEDVVDPLGVEAGIALDQRAARTCAARSSGRTLASAPP